MGIAIIIITIVLIAIIALPIWDCLSRAPKKHKPKQPRRKQPPVLETPKPPPARRSKRTPLRTLRQQPILVPKNASRNARDSDDPNGDQWNAPVHFKPHPLAQAGTAPPNLDDEIRAFLDEVGHPAKTERTLPTPKPSNPSSREQPTEKPLPPLHPREQLIRMRLEYAVDGDTICAATTYGGSVRIRLLGIDAPERGQTGYYNSKDWLEYLIGKNRKMDVLSRGKDHYGRTLATVRNENGVNVCQKMVADGMAYSTSYADNRDINYRKEEAQARTQRMGLWELPARERVHPSLYRRQTKRMPRTPTE